MYYDYLTAMHQYSQVTNPNPELRCVDFFTCSVHVHVDFLPHCTNTKVDRLAMINCPLV